MGKGDGGGRRGSIEAIVGVRFWEGGGRREGEAEEEREGKWRVAGTRGGGGRGKGRRI